MKRNYVPKGMTYTAEQIAALNARLDELSAALLADASQIFRQALGRHTAISGAQALAEETSAGLSCILQELNDEPGFGLELAVLQQQLALELQRAPELGQRMSESAWVESRSKDLARAFVAYWMEFADTDELRLRRSDNFVNELGAGTPSERLQHLEMLCSRNYLTLNDAGTLLLALNSVVSAKQTSCLQREPTGSGCDPEKRLLLRRREDHIARAGHLRFNGPH